MSTHNHHRLWDATGRDKLGFDAPDSYPRSHDTIAFGAPQAIPLLNGNFFVSFWCAKMSITHTRSAILFFAPWRNSRPSQ